MVKETSSERKARKIYRWLFIFLASLIYFGLLQFFLKLTNKQLGTIVIAFGIYSFLVQNLINWINRER
jgi:hypothetical protein